MKRAFDLALNGKGHTSPNPVVGCVIVHNGTIIGEGWHKKFGGAHAEVNAMNSVKEKHLLRDSTVYVSLEPCCHFGKTPPCSDMLASIPIKKVVISNLDPNPPVSGKGLEILRKAGIEVVEHVLENEGYEINKPFLHSFTKNRPYIILKWAQTADGFIARENYDSKWISNDLSRTIVHKWRSEIDAIVIGKNTALYDDPTLNVRNWGGNDPVRIVLDRELSLPNNLKLFNGDIPTIVYHQKKATKRKKKNLEYVHLTSPDFLVGLIQDLHDKKFQSVLIEGGATVLHHFIEQNLWDEARVFVSNTKFDKGIKAPSIPNAILKSKTEVMDDCLFIYENKL